ncbi:MAG: hypothetical protein WDA08_08535 [Weeksellaceae bacterium]
MAIHIFLKMALQLYNPFENLHFEDDTCFLSGEDLSHSNQKITVFPEWLLDRFDYRQRKFEMMDQVNSTTYGELKIPCSPRVQQAFDALDEEVKSAFDKGYDGMIALDEQRLFLWMGRMVYGVLYNEILLEKKTAEKQEKEFGLSETLTKRYAIFHLMLQSLISPVNFSEGLKPWSISIVRLKYSQEVFNHRDDAVNLIFSLGINGFGMIGCLQDNGILKKEYQEILNKTKGKTLHPIQFEEICAKFLYSNYLLNYTRNYSISGDGKSIAIEALPIVPENGKPIFKPWKNKMFSQVLQDYWSPWGFTDKEVVDVQGIPVTFLENAYTYELIDPDSIRLPF